MRTGRAAPPPSPQRALAPWGTPSRAPRCKARQPQEQQLLRGAELNRVLGGVVVETGGIRKEGRRNGVQRAGQRRIRSPGRRPRHLGVRWQRCLCLGGRRGPRSPPGKRCKPGRTGLASLQGLLPAPSVRPALCSPQPACTWCKQKRSADGLRADWLLSHLLPSRSTPFPASPSRPPAPLRPPRRSPALGHHL